MDLDAVVVFKLQTAPARSKSGSFGVRVGSRKEPTLSQTKTVLRVNG